MLLPATQVEGPDASLALAAPSRCDQRTTSAAAEAAIRSARATPRAALRGAERVVEVTA
jgi:hypothetical protein